jgi:hypothetical protein
MSLPRTLLFYDIECTIPRYKGDLVDIIEFGAIVVDAATMEEVATPLHIM